MSLKGHKTIWEYRRQDFQYFAETFWLGASGKVVMYKLGVSYKLKHSISFRERYLILFARCQYYFKVGESLNIDNQISGCIYV